MVRVGRTASIDIEGRVEADGWDVSGLHCSSDQWRLQFESKIYYSQH